MGIFDDILDTEKQHEIVMRILDNPELLDKLDVVITFRDAAKMNLVSMLTIMKTAEAKAKANAAELDLRSEITEINEGLVPVGFLEGFV